MHRDVTLVAKKSSRKLKYLKKENEKLQKKLLYSFKRSFQLGDKKFRVIYTLNTFHAAIYILFMCDFQDVSCCARTFERIGHLDGQTRLDLRNHTSCKL